MMGSAERELLPKGMRYALGLRLVLVGTSSLWSLLFAVAPNQAITTVIILGLNLWNLWYAYALPRSTRRHWLVAVDVVLLCGVVLTQFWTVTSDPRGAGPGC
ncbi:hypothetical protein [Kibdelosporangium philippinense]|uniref:hypothetical protein n=1 Tax=Kibdelosporangium philippinense TaxID=211113 RepID=UPI0036238192